VSCCLIVMYRCTRGGRTVTAGYHIHLLCTSLQSLLQYQVQLIPPCDQCMQCKRLTHGVIYIYIFFNFLHISFDLLVNWVWWDWPSMLLTNHHPSMLWHCWLGHLTRKIISEMTHNVSSGMWNPTIPYLTSKRLTVFCCLTFCLIYWLSVAQLSTSYLFLMVFN